MRKFLFLLIYISFSVSHGFAQYKLTGYITGNNQPIKDASVVLLKGDSITLVSGTITDEKGSFTFPHLKKDDYILTITHVSSKPIIEKIILSADKGLHYKLDMNVELDEVVIASDRSNITTMTSSGASFYLSSEAKNEKDIFTALQEIPKLSIDKNMRSISLADGSKPLILINGLRRGGGIASLNPADIESVEIIESPSIRYSKEGYTGIINLKMKKSQGNYHYLNVGANLNPQFIFGIADASYETGSENHSFYVSGQQFHFYQNKANVTNVINIKNTVKEINSSNISNYCDNFLAIGGDKVWSKKNYSSFSITMRQIPVSGNNNGEGNFETQSESKLFSYSRIYNDKSFTNTNNIYHKYTFENSNYIDALLRINFSKNHNEVTEINKGDDFNFSNNIHFKNNRNSGSLSLNYYFTPLNDLNANIGSQTYYQKNKVEQYNTNIPIFLHNEWNEHLYLDVDRTWNKKISVAASIGVDMFFVTSGEQKNNYYNFKPSVTMGYKASSKHSFRLSYNKYMQTPTVTQLNPYNTSTDSMIISTGNPLLKPQYIDNVQFNYTFTYKNLYLEPFAKYNLLTDYIRYKGEVIDNVYIRKPQNMGNYKTLQTGLNARYTLKNIGYITGRLSFQRSFFDNDEIRNTINGTFSLYLYYKKLSMNAYYYVSGIEYSPISKFISSPESQLTLTYKINKNWDVQAGMRFLFGKKVVEEWMYDDLYEKYYRNAFINRGNIMLIGFRYNLNNKNTKREQKKLQDTERGFKLINE
ncbi:MAG: TonB-dependent receptor [Bacteroidia bacterium]|nr:TonB-dependent receptor [Bacteroidia bacterium]